MTVDINRVKRLLDSDEPDYAALARLGPGVLPVLNRFIAGSDERLAAKAASAAGLLPHPGAADTLGRAARSRSLLVRLAVAGIARRNPDPRLGATILGLLADADAGVRKFAIKAAAARPRDAALAARVRSIQTSDPEPGNRALASRALRSSGGSRIA